MQTWGLATILEGYSPPIAPLAPSLIMMNITWQCKYLRTLQRRNLPSPYKTQCGSLQLKYFKGYSMHLCWLEKLTDHVVSLCNCKDWFMPGTCSCFYYYQKLWIAKHEILFKRCQPVFCYEVKKNCLGHHFKSNFLISLPLFSIHSESTII